MKEYLKMDDVFYLPINESEIMLMAAHDSPDRLECAVHAINSHDELVGEVGRLRRAVELASMTLDEVDRVLTERIKNGVYDLDDISAEVEGAIKRLSETE